MTKFGKMDATNEKQWRGLGAKVTGATHVRNHLPCQDAIRIESYGAYVVAAIADGHGSEACPYSNEGSQAAVDCLHEIFADIFMCVGTEAKAVIEDSRELRLPRQLAAQWRQRVEDIHHGAHDGEAFSYTLYGTTALCVVASPEFIFALQLGDGDILAVSNDILSEEKDSLLGYWLIEPEHIPGNETYSLCMPNCWRYIRTHMIYSDACSQEGDNEALTPDLIMLTTDGYYNSFIADDGFVKAGADIFKLLQTEGTEYILENLEGWLESSSNEGSGDDIAMAIVYMQK